MNLFPERDERRTRWILPAALLLSLIVHFGIGPVLRWWWPQLPAVLAKVVPIPRLTPEIVALSDAITIEKRTVPRPSRRSPQRIARPQRPRAIAQRPAVRGLTVPTLPPVPTAPPTRGPAAPPTFRAEHAAIHHPPAEATAAPRPHAEPSAATSTERNALSPQQIAALDAQFSRTIAQAQRALTDVPPQRRPPARSPQQMRYEAIMAGTPEMFLSAQGDCHSIQQDSRAGWNFYYLKCLIRYSDGYFEEVSFLWPHRFPQRSDPIDMYLHDGIRRSFLMQAPPDGFVLPQNFALSRAVCSFYQKRCADVIARERANGNQPATAGP